MLELTFMEGCLYSLVLLFSACLILCGLYAPEAIKRSKALTEARALDIRRELAGMSCVITGVGIFLVLRILTISDGSPNPAGILYSCGVATFVMLVSYSFCWSELDPQIGIPI